VYKASYTSFATVSCSATILHRVPRLYHLALFSYTRPGAAQRSGFGIDVRLEHISEADTITLGPFVVLASPKATDTSGQDPLPCIIIGLSLSVHKAKMISMN
jgi:hypothetical protein